MSDPLHFSRRAFLATAATAPALADLPEPPPVVELQDARWIWLPCQRVLPNSFVLFRKSLELPARPRQAWLRLTAVSRYRLTVNGHRVQWGPAPCDPRWLDVDRVDIAPYLEAGANAIGVEVLFYGVGDGTWVAGKPGLLARCDLEMPDGSAKAVVSDGSWLSYLDRAHPPGHYKRWFLRALQEEFDARLHPDGWDRPGYRADARWLPAMVLNVASDKPPVSGRGPYSGETIDHVEPGRCSLVPRSIPAVAETIEPVLRLAESGRIEWLRDPADWFDMRVPDSFRIERRASAREISPAAWELPNNAWATFEFPVQMVGFPRFTIDAAEGTIVDVMPQESHDPARTAWLDTHLFAWSRLVCKEGLNHYETFDYESLRWLQLNIRNASRPVRISGVGLRRRQFPWPHQPCIQTSEPALQRLFDSAVNTLRNSIIETVVDGMGRERQQYSGDGSHQMHAARYAFGETLTSARFVRTFSQGIMKDGYFSDSWPAYDRIARVGQKQMDGAYWGPLLDHGVGFNFDCWNYYLETGDLDAPREAYPKLQRFAAYLESVTGRDGLLRVEDLGIPTVWMDHVAYKQQRHRQCPFNLYTAAMLGQALAPLAKALGDHAYAERCRERGERILKAAVARFWSPAQARFVDNLPWLGQDREVRLSDRTLAMSILFGQCPGGELGAAVEALAECPPEMGISYPCNAGWRYWALARAGRVQPILDDLRRRWATMPSVLENTTIQEDWVAPPDSGAQWSHCGVAPLYITYMDLAGIRPLEPGFRRCRIRPQLGDLKDLKLTAYTVHGPIQFEARGNRVRVSLPEGCQGELVTPDGRTREIQAGGTAEA